MSCALRPAPFGADIERTELEKLLLDEFYIPPAASFDSVRIGLHRRSGAGGVAAAERPGARGLRQDAPYRRAEPRPDPLFQREQELEGMALACLFAFLLSALVAAYFPT